MERTSLLGPKSRLSGPFTSLSPSARGGRATGATSVLSNQASSPPSSRSGARRPAYAQSSAAAVAAVHRAQESVSRVTAQLAALAAERQPVSSNPTPIPTIKLSFSHPAVKQVVVAGSAELESGRAATHSGNSGRAATANPSPPPALPSTSGGTLSARSPLSRRATRRADS